MLESDMTPEDIAARDALQAALQINSKELGPRVAGGGDWQLYEFVMVAAWMRLEDGRVELTRVVGAGMPSYHVIGLLTEALEQGWDDTEEGENEE